MTEKLSPLDSVFIDMDDEDPRASLAISSVAVLEGPAPTQAEFLAGLQARLPLMPRYRQRLRQIPFDLGRPVWIDDPAFDLAHHVRRTALPAPGDDVALCALIGRVMSQRLDRSRPLWEYWVIEGLADNRWAIISKVHHCMLDGVSGTNLYRVIFDQSADGVRELPVDDWHPTAEPSSLRLAADAIADLIRNPIEQAKMFGLAATSPRKTFDLAVETARGLTKLAGALAPTTPSSLIGSIGQQRRFAIGRARLADVVAISRAAGVSVNDVVLAAVTRAFRTVLHSRGEHAAPHAVRTLIPVSVRAKGDEAKYENQISVMLAYLPVHIGDPVGRLWSVHEHVATLKGSREAQAGAALWELAKHEPFAPIAWGLRFAAHLPQRQVVTVTTNVPGPTEPLFMLGRRLLEVLPYVPIATQLRTGIAFFTYQDQLTFGVTGDFDFAPEVELIAAEIAAGIAELASTYPQPPAKRASAPKKTLGRKKAVTPKRAGAAPNKDGAPTNTMAKRAVKRSIGTNR